MEPMKQLNPGEHFNLIS